MRERAAYWKNPERKKTGVRLGGVTHHVTPASREVRRRCAACCAGARRCAGNGQGKDVIRFKTFALSSGVQNNLPQRRPVLNGRRAFPCLCSRPAAMALNEGRFLVIQRAEKRNRMEASVYNKMEKVRYSHAQKQLDEARVDGRSGTFTWNSCRRDFHSYFLPPRVPEPFKTNRWTSVISSSALEAQGLQELRIQRQFQRVRRTVVENNLRQAMLRRLERQASDRALGGTFNHNLGKYGGLKMDSLKHEVDQMLKDMDPGVRRAKRARKLLEKGRRDGRIRPYDMHSVCLPPIVADNHDEIDIVTAAQDGGAGEKGPTAEPNRTKLPPLRTLKASVGIDDSDDDL
ncbi:Methylcrotonoyl-CoA carboxylase subunit alpha, mitochondrial [Branchiostoma belcheri]|nr:Methylcrotonoyl-CoA carboxylase subunit alpha, mitochondrial [Branchiostoma belcheri]